MSTSMAAAINCLFILVLCISKSSSLQRCSVYGLPPISSEALVEELDNMSQLDFFVGPSMYSESEVLACSEEKEKLMQVLTANNIQAKTLVADASQMEKSRDHFGNLPLGELNWDNYYGLENIYAWLDKVVQNYPKLISMEVIGTTVENRQIRAYKIEKPGGSPSTRKATYLECLIHAREWTISGVCTYIINELTSNTNRYSDVLDKIRFYIVPVANPDGYVYSNGTNNHLWRKNRRVIPENAGITCTRPSLENQGVDLNRNWPYKWINTSEPCRHDYPGVPGVVEAEIQAITGFLLKHNDIDTFVDIHCYSQFILLPWAYTKDRTPNYNTLIKLGKDAADSAEQVDGIIFEPGQVSYLIKPSGGSSMDWAYAEGKIPHSFALEMRPTRKVATSSGYKYPFRVPVNELTNVVREGWLAVLTLATKTKQDYKSLFAGVGEGPKLSPVLLSAFVVFFYINLD